MTAKPKKEKKCRHKWGPVRYEDCLFCAGGSYQVCEKCDAARDADTKEIIYD